MARDDPELGTYRDVQHRPVPEPAPFESLDEYIAALYRLLGSGILDDQTRLLVLSLLAESAIGDQPNLN
jgi:hypothetical protein